MRKKRVSPSFERLEPRRCLSANFFADGALASIEPSGFAAPFDVAAEPLEQFDSRLPELVFEDPNLIEEGLYVPFPDELWVDAYDATAFDLELFQILQVIWLEPAEPQPVAFISREPVQPIHVDQDTTRTTFEPDLTQSFFISLQQDSFQARKDLTQPPAKTDLSTAGVSSRPPSDLVDQQVTSTKSVAQAPTVATDAPVLELQAESSSTQVFIVAPPQIFHSVSISTSDVREPLLPIDQTGFGLNDGVGDLSGESQSDVEPASEQIVDSLVFRSAEPQLFLPAALNLMNYTIISSIAPMESLRIEFEANSLAASVAGASIELSSLARVLAMVSDNTEGMADSVSNRNLTAAGAIVGMACGITYVTVKKRRDREQELSFRVEARHDLPIAHFNHRTKTIVS